METPTVHIINDPLNEDRKRLMEEVLKEQRMEAKIWASQPGNIANAHKRIVQHALINNLDEVVIAEDDVFFYAQDGFEYFMRNKPPSFDLYLSGVYISTPDLPNKDNRVKQFAGMQLYIVARKFYKAFISVHTDKLNSIDNALSMLAWHGLADIAVCYPFAAVQREDLPSTNPLLYGQLYKHKYFFNSKNLYGYKEVEAGVQ